MRLMLSLATLSFALSTPFLLADDVEELTKDHREFALSLYPVLDTPDANLIFSPYSIACCLSMVYVGARGETAAQMQNALHFRGRPEDHRQNNLCPQSVSSAEKKGRYHLSVEYRQCPLGRSRDILAR